MSTQQTTQRDFTTQLHGNLGVPSICFMVIAAAAPLTVVGGPMVLGFALGNGAGLPTIYVLTAIVLVCFALGFTAMTPFVRSAGAFYAYIHVGLGARAGISAGYLAVVSYVALYVGVYALFGTAATALSESFGGPGWPWWVWSLMCLLVTSFLGYHKIELSGRVLSILLVAEVALVLILDAAIVFRGGSDGLSTKFLDPSVVFSGAPGNALIFAVLSFIGVEATAVFRTEAKDPDRTVPRALFISLIGVGLFYAVASWAVISAVGDDKIVGLASSDPEGVLPLVSLTYLGTVGQHITAVLFVTSIFAAAVTFHNVVARYLFTLSKRRLAPQWLGYSHAEYGSPHRASVATSVATGGLLVASLLAGLDPIGQTYTWTAGLASIGYVTLLLATCAAILVFFGRNPTLAPSRARGLIAPGFGLLGLALIVVLMLSNIQLLVGDQPAVSATILGLLVLTVVGGVVMARRERTDGLDTMTDAID